MSKDFKKTDSSVMSAIKEMEKTAREEAKAANPPPVAEKIFFDQWWANVSSRIPATHHKEVIFADFKARGLTLRESTADYEIALKMYGL